MALRPDGVAPGPGALRAWSTAHAASLDGDPRPAGDADTLRERRPGQAAARREAGRSLSRLAGDTLPAVV